MTALERYEKGLITRGEYLELTGLTDTTSTVEIAHMEKLANKYQFGWLVNYARKLTPEIEDMRDDIIDMAYDCRNLRSDPIFRAGDYRDSFETLIAYIREFRPPVPVIA